MARPRWRSLAITAVKSSVAIVVLWAVGRHVIRTYSDLRARSESLHFEPVWLTGGGCSLSGWTTRIRCFLRACAAIQPDARAASSGVASVHCEPPGQVRARKGDGGGRALGDGRSVRRAGINGGRRHILRNTGDDGAGGLVAAAGSRPRPERIRSSSRCGTSAASSFPSTGWPASRPLVLALAFLIVVLPPVFVRVAQPDHTSHPGCRSRCAASRHGTAPGPRAVLVLRWLDTCSG